jgi:hypothetical protein
MHLFQYYFNISILARLIESLGEILPTAAGKWVSVVSGKLARQLTKAGKLCTK